MKKITGDRDILQQPGMQEDMELFWNLRTGSKGLMLCCRNHSRVLQILMLYWVSTLK